MSGNGFLEAALFYLARGWCVMAVPEGTKERRRQWKHLQRRLRTPEEVRQDFAQEPGTPNVAIITGSVSRLLVVEADTPEAAARLKALKLPPTLTAKTRRGPHLYFRTDREIPTRKLDGLELRAEGSYVLAPPSLHPSGLVYAFEDADAPVAELPEAVLSLFQVWATAAEANAKQVPERWLRLVESNPRARAAWQGEGEHKDRSGSGKDLFLTHEARRCGFRPEEARRIVMAAPWSVEGGRPADYLDRTITRAYQAGQKRQLPAYGVAPASPVDSGAFARLSPSAKALYHVLCVRRMRPSGAVIRNSELLARDAGIAPRTVGPSGAELKQAGLIERKRMAGGRMRYLVLLPSVQRGVRGPEREVPMQEKASPSRSPSVVGGVRQTASPPVQGGVSASLVHEIERGPFRDPGVSGSSEGVKGIAAPPTPSLRHTWQILPTGERVVYEKRPDGELAEVGRTSPETGGGP